MKKLVILLSTVFLFTSATAQFNILDRAKQSVKNKVNSKIDEKINSGVNKSVDAVDDEVSGKNKGKKNTNNGSKRQNGEDDVIQPDNGNKGNSKNNDGFKAYSKFDFVPGEKLVAAEDFSQDNIGDFPDKWNTNGSGEIVTTSNATGKFLQTKKEATMYPEWIKNLPDNFTVEFDLLCNDKFNFYSHYFNIGFTTEKNIGKNWRDFGRFGNGGANNDVVTVGFHPTNAGMQQGMTAITTYSKGNQILHNEADQKQFVTKTNKTKVHVSIWKQKQRIRVYLDDNKIWDIPKAFESNVTINSIFFRNDGADNDIDAMYFGNVRIAIGAPDTRNKLITEGKFITHGILFDVNSDKIKPESYGAIKDIANVLTENADVKVKIIGHTDSDGDDKANLDLSKRRADAVKNFLSKEFGIDINRMQTDGKGESQPIDANTTTVGKANNRRVEFIKQ